MTQRTSGHKRWIATLVAVTSCLVLNVAAPPVARAAQSPPGQVLIVNENLTEDTAGDVARDGDVRLFVDRLLHQAPYSPDVLLLQEVNRRAMIVLARILERRTPFDYSIAIGPGARRSAGGRTTTLVGQGILVNSDTIKKKSRGGVLVTRHTRSQAAPGQNNLVKTHAYTLVGERGTDVELSLATLHFVKDSSLRTMKISRRLKNAWSKRIADKLRGKFRTKAPRHVSVIAGDFNQKRCRVPGPGCTPQPFWRTLAGDPYDYKDSIHTMVPYTGAPVDFIFVNKTVIKAGHDDNYTKAQQNDPSRYYSDHVFRWALVQGPDTTGPSRPRKVRGAYYGGGTTLRWFSARDGGSGLARHEIWRSRPNGRYERLAHKSGMCDLDFVDACKYTDNTAEKDVTYLYKIRGVDSAGNNGAFTEAVRVRS